jgi:hypothetical protein
VGVCEAKETNPMAYIALMNICCACLSARKIPRMMKISGKTWKQ